MSSFSGEMSSSFRATRSTAAPQDIGSKSLVRSTPSPLVLPGTLARGVVKRSGLYRTCSPTCDRGQVFPSEYGELELPKILTALPLTPLTLMAQRVAQFRQDVAMSSSVSTAVSVPFSRG